MLHVHRGSSAFVCVILEILHSLLQPKKTIVTNVETLNAKIDVQHVLDPSLRSAGNIGDCHFLSSLKVRANCALTLCSDLPYWDNNEEPISSEQFKVRLPFIPGTMHVYRMCYQYTLLLDYGL